MPNAQNLDQTQKHSPFRSSERNMQSAKDCTNRSGSYQIINNLEIRSKTFYNNTSKIKAATNYSQELMNKR